jgi:hypothetical protein
MAVSFLTATKRFETVLRNEVIFSVLSLRVFASFVVVFNSAVNASPLVILPSFPVPLTSLTSIPFSAKILAAAATFTSSSSRADPLKEIDEVFGT